MRKNRIRLMRRKNAKRAVARRILTMMDQRKEKIRLRLFHTLQRRRRRRASL